MSVEFKVLGPLEAYLDGQRLQLGGAKQELVLAALLLDPDRVVSVDRLVDWVWGDDALETSPATLQVYISKIRKLLSPAGAAVGAPVLETRRPGYVIHVDADQLDLLRFERHRRSGEAALAAGDHRAATAGFRAALELWRGVPIAGLAGGTAAEAAVTRIELGRLAIREQLADAEMALGRHREIVDELRGWLAEHPLDERLRGLLMLALYRCGMQAAALATFREGRDLLVEELGIDPSRELRELEHRILDQDPSLDLHSAVASFDPMAIESTVFRASILLLPAHAVVDGRVVPLDQPVTTIGRRPDRDIAFSSPSVSRMHAEIRQSGGAYVVVDLVSANGTLVNGERVRERELRDGDTIRVGDSELVFRLDNAG